MDKELYNDIVRIAQDIRKDEPDEKIKVLINSVQRGLLALMSEDSKFVEETFTDDTRLKIEWLVYTWYKDNHPGSDINSADAAKELKKIIKDASKPQTVKEKKAS